MGFLIPLQFWLSSRFTIILCWVIKINRTIFGHVGVIRDSWFVFCSYTLHDASIDKLVFLKKNPSQWDQAKVVDGVSSERFLHPSSKPKSKSSAEFKTFPEHLGFNRILNQQKIRKTEPSYPEISIDGCAHHFTVVLTVRLRRIIPPKRKSCCLRGKSPPRGCHGYVNGRPLGQMQRQLFQNQPEPQQPVIPAEASAAAANSGLKATNTATSPKPIYSRGARPKLYASEMQIPVPQRCSNKRGKAPIIPLTHKGEDAAKRFTISGSKEAVHNCAVTNKIHRVYFSQAICIWIK